MAYMQRLIDDKSKSPASYGDSLFGPYGINSNENSEEFPGWYVDLFYSHLPDENYQSKFKYLIDNNINYYPYANEFTRSDMIACMIKNAFRQDPGDWQLGDKEVFDWYKENSGDIRNLLISVSSSVLNKLSGMRTKYPLRIYKDNTSLSPSNYRQSLEMNNAVNADRERLMLLIKLWVERNNAFDRYMSETYNGVVNNQANKISDSTNNNDGTSHNEGTNKSNTDTTNNTVGTNHSETDTNNKTVDDANNVGNTTNEDYGNSSLVGDVNTKGSSTSTDDGNTSGTSNNDTTSRGATSKKSSTDGSYSKKASGNNKNINANADYPEANGLGGVGDGSLEPGSLGYEYLHDSNETSGNNESNESGSNNSSTKDDGSSSNKTVINGSTSGHSNNKGNKTNESDTKTNNKNQNYSKGNGTSKADNHNENDFTGKSVTYGKNTSDSKGNSNTVSSFTNDGKTHDTDINHATVDDKLESSKAGQSIDSITLSDSYQTLIESKERIADELFRILRVCYQRYVGSFNENFIFGQDESSFDGNIQSDK